MPEQTEMATTARVLYVRVVCDVTTALRALGVCCLLQAAVFMVCAASLVSSCQPLSLKAVADRRRSEH